MNGCTITCNHLLKQTIKPKQPPEIDASPNTTLSSNSGLLQLLKDNAISKGSDFSLEVVAFTDSGFTVSYIDKSIVKQLKYSETKRCDERQGNILNRKFLLPETEKFCWIFK